MILDKYVKVKWNPKNVKYYKSLGYEFTKFGEEFCIPIEDLSNGSNIKIKIKCDYCNKVFEKAYYSYIAMNNKDKDCCGSPNCTGNKAKESLIDKYGVDNCRKIDGINDKIKQTNLERYGCENPFANEEIKEKIKQYNLNNYGVEFSMQREEVKQKVKETTFKRYGCENYGKFWSETHTKELSPNWIGDSDYKRSQRATHEYNQWRKLVYERDDYTCQCCKIKRTKSSQPKLNAHHIINFSSNEELRFSVDNGITLCEICHNDFHKKYGKKNNTLAQLQEFLDEKIC